MPDVDELQGNIAREMISAAGDHPWRSISLDYRKVEGFGEAEGELITETGEVIRLGDLGRLGLFLRQLRGEMATPAHGAWFSVRITAERDGDFDMAFNYDQKPAWDVEPDTDMYIEDQRRYPRPAHELPDWHPAKNRH